MYQRILCTILSINKVCFFTATTRIFAVLKKFLYNRGSSSFGRARPCQGRGGRFEPGLPLSSSSRQCRDFFSLSYSGGGTGRHAGLKILFAVMRVTVQFRSRVQRCFIIQQTSRPIGRLFYFNLLVIS